MGTHTSDGGRTGFMIRFSTFFFLWKNLHITPLSLFLPKIPEMGRVERWPGQGILLCICTYVPPPLLSSYSYSFLPPPPPSHSSLHSLSSSFPAPFSLQTVTKGKGAGLGLRFSFESQHPSPAPRPLPTRCYFPAVRFRVNHLICLSLSVFI